MADGLEQFLRIRPDVVRVRIASVQGSAPRETDAEMFVAKDAIFGTVGGGQLEYRAIAHARDMIATGRSADRLNVALGPEIGQCCGGRVRLAFDLIDDATRGEIVTACMIARATRPMVHICGAGHVGRALADLFAHLPVHTLLIDSRADELRQCRAPVERRLTALPEADIREAPPGSAFIVLTHDHALDFLLTSEALSRGDAAYVGLIGSKTKRAKFERFHSEQSRQSDTARLVCPIGATGSPDKRPEVIAAFVVAEVMTTLTTQPGKGMRGQRERDPAGNVIRERESAARS